MDTWSSLGKVPAGRKPIFLYRNIRQWRKRAAALMRASLSNANQPEKITE